MTNIVVPNVGTVQVPENKFEAILFLNELKWKLNELTTIIDKDITTRVDNLVSENCLEDNNYKLVPTFANKKTSVLDEEKFKNEMPDAYKNSLTIKASEAEKVIGKDNLRKLIIESYGWNVFEQYANCTLTEARKNIPKASLENYITESYPQTGMEVIRKC